MTILTTVPAAVAHVKEGVIENNRVNSARFSDWKDGQHAVETYIDGEAVKFGGEAGIYRGVVTQLVDEWLKTEVAFEAAMTSVERFIPWCASNEPTSEIVSRMINAGFHDRAPDWADGLRSDYVTTLASGEVVVWGAEHSDGRDLDVYKPAATIEEAVLAGQIRVRSWREADAA